MQRPPRPDHPLEYTAAQGQALIALVLACLLAVTVYNYWPATPPPAPSPEEHARFVADIEAFVSASRQASDSVAAAKAERQRAYAERQAAWEERRAGWARERAERQERYRDRDRRRARSPRAATAIDYSLPEPALASLDVNAVDSATLLRLGVPVAITARWLKYRRSGGSFRRPSDIGKLYGLPDTTAARLQAYFAAPQPIASENAEAPGTSAPRVPSAPTASSATVFDVNTVTAEELESLRGIGAYTAEKIVEYRGWLGGYVSVDQLLEARGVRAENLEAVRARLRVGTAPAPRIRVNAATTFDEWRHPYLKWKKAKVLLAYREQHGPYRSPDDLLLSKVVTPEEVARLTPYLDFET